MASSLYITPTPTTATATATTISIFLLYCTLLPYPTLSGRVFMSRITPNFTASFLQFVDNSGAFLASKNGSFEARITNPKRQRESQSFYLVIIHVLSDTTVWSANRNTPISKSSELRFSPDGLILYNDTGHPIWSTPPKNRSVSYLQLLESGNLIMVDDMNKTVWESFDSPTDVLVTGQELRVGKSLVSSVNEEDLTEGSYRFVIGENDAMLQWNEMTYYRLSMDTKAFKDSSFAVEYMVMNFTAMYLMGSNGTAVVIRIILHNSNDVAEDSSSFRIFKLDPNGVFSIIIKINDRTEIREFTGPDDKCRVPSICRRLNVCTNGGICQCAPGFHSDPVMKNGDCVPADNSFDLPDSCDDSSLSNGTSMNYISLRDNMDYFSNDFTDPTLRDVNLSVCQDLCSRNCTCLGIFHGQDSGSCYPIQNYLGSIMMKSNPARDKDRLGYIKAIVVENPNGHSEDNKSDFPVLAMVLLPLLGILSIAMVLTIIWFLRRKRRRKWARNENKNLGRANSSDSSAEGEFEFSAIPGLPVRFNHDELVVATEDFKTRIGSGGFGTVYRGTLHDGIDIAVKKITCLGAQGKREFLTEIGIIGKIHHVNLVKLKGFCTHKGQKFLVYEYMNRSSLDRTLFGNEGPALEWKERYEIALGTARGLAYLHTGCEHKILHCDIKPENILLHDNLQVKISDFGLSKLLSPEESGLFTTLRGTRGYLAPEWLTSSAISDRTDVYSYGMVLLEILRGKKNSSAQTRNNNGAGNDIDAGHIQSSSSSGEAEHQVIYFPLFALEMHEEGRYSELVDPRLGGRVRMEEVMKLVRVALCCVQEEPSLRPSMSNVVGMLEGVLPLGEPRIESLNFLRFYGRRFTEASRLDENNEQNEFILHRQPLGDSSTTGSYNSFSYMSSHQLSGPR